MPTMDRHAAGSIKSPVLTGIVLPGLSNLTVLPHFPILPHCLETLTQGGVV